MYRLEYSPRAKKDIKFWERSNKDTLKKIRILLNEIAEHPRSGTGWPEYMQGDGKYWSRHINKKDIIKYRIYDDTVYVYIISARGHYDDH